MMMSTLDGITIRGLTLLRKWKGGVMGNQD